MGGGANIGGAHLIPVPPPKNPGCPNFGVGMHHARSGGDALNRPGNMPILRVL